MTKNYQVKGIETREDAERVESELAQIPGFQGAEVSVESGHLTVDGHAISDEHVRDAVETAGFSLLDE
ncbi:heavy-metal-associated domain-containing protein [Corynebacterium pilosum]|uniref:Cation transport protein n=1 Tax=Corynebacterium pilosum TaxID=35756 RepID=A0A376CKQ1_9CORY|nr:heavy-metal-associated domain-containing protein [Corynebacterium pilosum]STC69081.1 Cation transport protein [Corynebacterium pilosum]